MQTRFPCRGKSQYVQCSVYSDFFLDQMEKLLRDGVAGASAFHAEAALVVTWENLRPNIGRERSYSTYQLIWLTNLDGTLSYTIINYDRLGYDAADLNGNSVTGRCQAIFNGGNHTGSVFVDQSLSTKERPSSLAERSSVPHIVRGRYLHRVDDIVRPTGCSNKTGGTFLLNVYPNIVNMLGEISVEVNAMCLNPAITYVLMIEQREMASCEIINTAIARCHIPRVLDWGTKNIYFQPLSGLANDEKAYVGYMYFVPPTMDPLRLDIGNIYKWFQLLVSDDKEIIWYPRNFTKRKTSDESINVNDPLLYQMQLGLFIIGYKESRDDEMKKFRPMHRLLARFATYRNLGDEMYRWKPQRARINLNQVEEWYLSEEERKTELSSYRIGYFRLAPLSESNENEDTWSINSSPGITSAPISLHWLWPLKHDSERDRNKDNVNIIKEVAAELCSSWFNEDGAQSNFIRNTEMNSSCPCKENQAILDIGRFMPHPRCSQYFRDVSCTETMGSQNCYMSVYSVQGAFHFDHESENSYSTHHGQICCYDEMGYLMQTSYQSVIKIDESTPYNPGFPVRAHEFGTPPYQGIFEVPGLSTFHHDIMPYYYCCKYTDYSCQMFYWRRPSSACQEYKPAFIASAMGAGTITTFGGQKFIFNDPGIYDFLYIKKTISMPEVKIQARFERFPDRSVDFSGNNLQQFELVQPTNATVITGIAIDCSDTDRVHIILRKDTRRARYRTTVLVNDIVYYFDNLQLQRFKDLTIYTNNVQNGQAELYIILRKAQIGLRIRESYALDMDRFPIYMESFGLLDIIVSLSSIYTERIERIVVDEAKINGLLTYSTEIKDTSEIDPSMTWNEVNNPSKREDIINKYRVKSEFERETIGENVFQQADSSKSNIFDSSSDPIYSTLPDIFLKKPVYTTDVRFKLGPNRFHPPTFETITALKGFCEEVQKLDTMEKGIFKEIRQCPLSIKILENECGGSLICEMNSLLLQARILGDKAQDEFVTFLRQRHLAIAHYNSCGAITLEYPDYMIKGPSSVGSAYLEGDFVTFSCFQDHVINGDTNYKCSRYYYGDNPNHFSMRWNEGTQPWCRSRQREDLLTWLFWTGIFLASLLFLAFLFICCWYVKIVDTTLRDELFKSESELVNSDGIKYQPLEFHQNQFKNAIKECSYESDVIAIDKPPINRNSSENRKRFGENQEMSKRRVNEQRISHIGMVTGV